MRAEQKSIMNSRLKAGYEYFPSVFQLWKVQNALTQPKEEEPTHWALRGRDVRHANVGDT